MKPPAIWRTCLPHHQPENCKACRKWLVPASPGIARQLAAIPRTPLADHSCNQSIAGEAVIVCGFGPERPDVPVVALVGGSHSLHWFPAFEIMAREGRLRVLNITKAACPLGGEAVNESCRRWQTAAVAELARLKPDAVFTTATRPADDARGDVVPESYKAVWDALRAQGLRVVAIRDNPWMPGRTADCVGRNPDNLRACGVAREKALSDANPAAGFNGLGDVSLIDLSDYFCTADFCPAVADGIVLYSDSNHLTKQFARNLSFPLEAELARILPKFNGSKP